MKKEYYNFCSLNAFLFSFNFLYSFWIVTLGRDPNVSLALILSLHQSEISDFKCQNESGKLFTLYALIFLTFEWRDRFSFHHQDDNEKEEANQRCAHDESDKEKHWNMELFISDLLKHSCLIKVVWDLQIWLRIPEWVQVHLLKTLVRQRAFR